MSRLRYLACGFAGVLALLLLPEAASAQVHRELYFQNQCRYPIRLLLHHRHDDGTPASHGWYSIEPKTNLLRLESSPGHALIHTEGTDLFFYAEVTTPGVTYYWQGDAPVTYNGIEYRMMRSALRMQDGKLYLWTHCDNLAG